MTLPAHLVGQARKDGRTIFSMSRLRSAGSAAQPRGSSRRAKAVNFLTERGLESSKPPYASSSRSLPAASPQPQPPAQQAALRTRALQQPQKRACRRGASLLAMGSASLESAPSRPRVHDCQNACGQHMGFLGQKKGGCKEAVPRSPIVCRRRLQIVDRKWDEFG